MTGPGQKPLSATPRRLRKAARLSNAVVAQRPGTSVSRRPSDPETGKRVPRETEAGAGRTRVLIVSGGCGVPRGGATRSGARMGTSGDQG
jgi:hypothetical protein